MDGPFVKDSFIGFKCEPRLKQQLIDASDRYGLTLSKMICYFLYKALDQEVSE